MCLEIMRGMMQGVDICCFIEGYENLRRRMLLFSHWKGYITTIIIHCHISHWYIL